MALPLATTFTRLFCGRLCSVFVVVSGALELSFLISLSCFDGSVLGKTLLALAISESSDVESKSCFMVVIEMSGMVVSKLLPKDFSSSSTVGSGVDGAGSNKGFLGAFLASNRLSVNTLGLLCLLNESIGDSSTISETS